MRLAVILFLTAAALGQHLQTSHTTESLRGVSAVTAKVAWASGTHGMYLRTTDGGAHWQSARVPGAEALDFRAVVAFSANEALLMSIGPGEQSRIYHTTDAGQHWQLQFTNANPKGFYDSMIFFDRTHGIALGDPVPDETGKLKFEIIITEDGKTWHPVPTSQIPEAVEGEGAFAASNTCLAILPATSGEKKSSAPRDPFKKAAPSPTETKNESTPRLGTQITPDHSVWFATGGAVARVFHSSDRGQTWQVADTPIVHGADSTGIFSIAFRDPLHGVIAGGDYKHPEQDGANLAFTEDGGKTWKLSSIKPQAFFSAAAYDRENPDHLYLIAQDFIYEVRNQATTHRIDIKNPSEMKLNAASPTPGGAFVVGARGAVLSLP